MSCESFCKNVLPALTAAAFSYECFFFILEEFRKAQARPRMTEIDQKIEEAMYKFTVAHVYQDLEGLEKEIKASQNENLLRLHAALVKNIEVLKSKEYTS